MSVVVSSVLIILIVVVGIGILWAVIAVFLDKNTAGGSEDCFTLDIEPIECGYVAAGRYCVQFGSGEIRQADLQNHLVYSVIKRNEGEGNLKSAKLIFIDAGGNSYSEDLVDLLIPEFNFEFKRDLSRMLELETHEVAIEAESLFIPERVEVAPIVGDGLLCEPYTGFFPCKNLAAESYIKVAPVQAISCTECNDGFDNDGDTQIDYPNDLGCSSATDNDESA